MQGCTADIECQEAEPIQREPAEDREAAHACGGSRKTEDCSVVKIKAARESHEVMKRITIKRARAKSKYAAI
jgi:hypothetical protein